MMGYGFGGGFPGHMVGYSPFGGLMIVGFILFAALLGVGLWALLRRDHHVAHATTTGPSVYSAPNTPAAPVSYRTTAGDPLEIVRERLARGEIDVNQYSEIVAALQGTTPPSA